MSNVNDYWQTQYLNICHHPYFDKMTPTSFLQYSLEIIIEETCSQHNAGRFTTVLISDWNMDKPLYNMYNNIITAAALVDALFCK